MRKLLSLAALCLLLSACHSGAFEDSCMSTKIEEFIKAKDGNPRASILTFETSHGTLYGFNHGNYFDEPMLLYNQDCDYICHDAGGWGQDPECPPDLEIYSFNAYWPE